jgi:hypothetical protein
MEHTRAGTAAVDWAEAAAQRDPARRYPEGFEDGLLLGLALSKLDREWAEQALEQLFTMHTGRLADRLAGTGVPAPRIEQHRMLVFAEAQEILRGSRP